jgi:hypothetical protein
VLNAVAERRFFVPKMRGMGIGWRQGPPHKCRASKATSCSARQVLIYVLRGSGLPMPSRPDVRCGHPCPPLSRRWLRFRPPGFAGHLRRLEGIGSPALPVVAQERFVREAEV